LKALFQKEGYFVKAKRLIICIIQHYTFKLKGCFGDLRRCGAKEPKKEGFMGLK